MQEGKSNFFWTSFSDLMISLFFIMLVLYVITFISLKKEQDRIKVSANKWEEVQKVQNAINGIDPKKKYFYYDSLYKKHVLKIDINFQSGKSDIMGIDQDKRLAVQAAGRMVDKLIDSFPKVKFLVIIEGQSSKDNYVRNFPLSHERALGLKKYWESCKIFLDKKSNCELILAGSGEGGIPREQPDYPPRNQRFLIHVIPKLGTI